MEKEMFYGVVAFRLKAAKQAYDAYMVYRTYLHARVIFRINKANCKFVCDHIHLADKDDMEGLLKLVLHWSQWMEQFRIHEQQTRPSVDSEFIFAASESVLQFPSDVAALVMSRSKIPA